MKVIETASDASLTATARKSPSWKSEFIACLLLSIAFGIFVCTASSKIDNREAHRSESIEMERAIFHGQPFHNLGRVTYMAPWQNRVLFPAMLELAIHLHVFSAEGWYVLLRFLLSIAMFGVFWVALRMNAQAEQRLAAAGLLLLAYCLVCTFIGPFGVTFDFPDAMFMAIFIAAALRKNRLLLFIVSVVAAANRESSAFAGVIWFFLYGIDENRKINLRESAYAALVSISSYTAVILLRYGFGGAKAISNNTQYLPFRNNFYQVKNFLLHPTPFSWVGLVICMIVPCSLWILFNRQSLDFISKRLLMATGALTIVSAIFGNIGDTRIFIPVIVIAIFVAIRAQASVERTPVNYQEVFGTAAG